MTNASPVSPPLQVAIIGASGYAKVHLRVLETLAQEGLVKLCAATVINQSEEAATCAHLKAAGCRIYSDYQTMLSEEAGRIDLCCIPTGIAWHRPMTLAALEAGCHVLVEKPAAGTVEDVDAMIQAERESDRLVFVGFQDLFLQAVQGVKQAILDQQIGRIQSVRVIASWPRPDSYYGRNNWAGSVQSGGQFVYDSPANNALAHYLIGAFYLAGESLNAVAQIETVEAELYRCRNIESFDTIAARLTTANQVQIHYTVTHCGAQLTDPILVIQGEHGEVEWRVNEGFRFSPSGDYIDCPNDDSTRREMFLTVIRSIREQRNEGCTLQMARAHTQFIEQLHKQCPIQDVADVYKIEYNKEADRMIQIESIDAYLSECLQSGKLFSELGAPWATQPTAFTVDC